MAEENTAKTQEKSPEKDSWAKARQIANKLGYVPSSFSVAVRLLVADQYENKALLRPVTKFQVARILKTPSFLAILYYAVKDLRSGYLAKTKALSVGQMMDYFDPIDLAALIACFLYYRKAKKFLGPERWLEFSAELQLEAAFGAISGVSVPKVGMGVGLLLGCIRHFALAAMMLQNEEHYHTYRRDLKIAKKRVDEKVEQEKWGCTARQIAVFLLSNMGFGTLITDGISVGLDPTSKLTENCSEVAASMIVGKAWIDGLMAGRNQPFQKYSAQWFPMDADRVELEKKIEQVREGNPHWLNKTKRDIDPKLAPELFVKTEGGGDVPEEIAAVFSLDQITKMEEEDFDDLIDQMDRELEGKTKPGTITLSSKDIKDLENMVDE